jgi:hypothetical protein
MEIRKNVAKRMVVNLMVLALVLALTAGLALAQGSEPEEVYSPLAPLGTAFAYQGQLEKDGSPVSGDCSMTFRLFDDAAAGNQVGSDLDAVVSVGDGMFSVNLDFGGTAFSGEARWLEIHVKCGGDTSFTNLGRQALTAAPYALYASGAPWSGLTGIPAGFGDGTDDNTTYSAGTGLALTGTSFNVMTSTIQQRVAGICASGQAIQTVHADGSVTCETVTGGMVAHDHWGETWMGGSGTGLSLGGGQTGLSGNGATTGVLGSASSTTGRGVHGYVDTATGENYGVYGRSASSSGRGVYGYANSSSGTTTGVYGESDSADGRGIYGHATSNTGVTYGVVGESSSSIGRGVAGYGLFGVLGESTSTSGSGVFGSATAASGTTTGVLGESDSTSGRGLFGSATAGTGTTFGVRGEADSNSGRGVYGLVESATGATYGVYGRSLSNSGRGVFGEVTSSSGTTYAVRGDAESPDGYGVYGYNDAGSGNAVGVYGSSSVSSTGRGVYGIGRHGVYGESYASGGYGVYAQAQTTSGTNYGVYGESHSSDGYAGYFVNSGSNGIALYAEGSGTSSSKATLRVDNTDTSGGVAGYLSNDSSYATAKFRNSGGGHVLYLQNGGSGDTGSGGGDFINATNSTEGDTQFRVSTNGTVYADGGYHCGNAMYDVPLLPASAAFGQNDASLDICLQDSSPADFAEMFPAKGELGPGDVLAIDLDGELTKSSEPYQTTIAGVYSLRPSYLGNARFADEEGYAPLALLGVVPVKASAENGSIQPGDLLVASSLPGHAMRAGDSPPQGTVIGKALEPLADGTGYIQMLVTLQ